MADAGEPDHPYGGFSADIIEVLRQAHSSTQQHQLLKIDFVPSAEPGVVTVEMPVAPGAFNGSGNLHGGAIATMVDVAAGSAAARAGTFGRGETPRFTADRTCVIWADRRGRSSAPRPASCAPGVSSSSSNAGSSTT